MQSDTESEVVGNYSVTKACFFLHQLTKSFVQYLMNLYQMKRINWENKDASKCMQRNRKILICSMVQTIKCNHLHGQRKGERNQQVQLFVREIN
jgi:hypothetical protein